MMNRVLPFLAVALLICYVSADIDSDEVVDTPYCGGITSCGGAVLERLVDDHECCPCVCKEEGWCRVCLGEPTAICECMCANPNVTDPQEVPVETPPPMSSDQVTEALELVKEKAENISQEIKDNRMSIANCFPDEEILSFLNPVRNNARKAVLEAEIACAILANNSNLDNPDLLRSLDEVADRLERAKENLEVFMVEMGKLIAIKVDKDVSPPFAWDNPADAWSVISIWNVTAEDDLFCYITKNKLQEWHPRFWSWGTWGFFSFNMWAQLCYCWFCMIYIRVVIIVKVWWQWVFTPWLWFLWPYHWCWWWSVAVFG